VGDRIRWARSWIYNVESGPTFTQRSSRRWVERDSVVIKDIDNDVVFVVDIWSCC